MYLKFSQIRPRTTDLAVLQRLKLMLPPFLGKLVAIHLIHFKFVGFEDIQQILQLNMGLSAAEHLKTYDAEKKLFPLFLVVFNLILSDVAKPTSIEKMCKYSQFQRVSNRSGIKAKSPPSVIFRRFGSLVDVSGTVVWLVFMHFLLTPNFEYSVSFRGER